MEEKKGVKLLVYVIYVWRSCRTWFGRWIWISGGNKKFSPFLPWVLMDESQRNYWVGRTRITIPISRAFFQKNNSNIIGQKVKRNQKNQLNIQPDHWWVSRSQIVHCNWTLTSQGHFLWHHFEKKTSGPWLGYFFS